MGFNVGSGPHQVTLADQRLPEYRFPLSVISHGVWFQHRYTLGYQDIEELLVERSVDVALLCPPMTVDTR